MIEDDWSRDRDGMIVRRLLKLDLDNGDVAAATYPAYAATEIHIGQIVTPAA